MICNTLEHTIDKNNSPLLRVVSKIVKFYFWVILRLRFYFVDFDFLLQFLYEVLHFASALLMLLELEFAFTDITLTFIQLLHDFFVTLLLQVKFMFLSWKKFLLRCLSKDFCYIELIVAICQLLVGQLYGPVARLAPDALVIPRKDYNIKSVFSKLAKSLSELTKI